MSYAAPQDMLNRYDARILGDIVSDVGVRVPPAALLTNVVLQAALDSGAGQIDQACFVGQRYNSAQLGALTGQDQAVLFQLNCDLAYVILRKRRGQIVDKMSQYVESEKILDHLRQGDRIFAVPANEAAGLPSAQFPSMQQYAQLNLMRDYASSRYFTRRRPQQEI